MGSEETVIETIKQVVDCPGVKLIVHLRVGPPSLDVKAIIARLY